MFETITEINKGMSLALGFFDGVHLGHQKVISNAVKIARDNGRKSAVITFSNHPSEFFNKGIKYITTLEERNKIISSLGIDFIFDIKFDSDIANMSHQKYLELIIEKFKPIAISTGFNHTFGKSKLGTPTFLRDYQEIFDYHYYEIPPTLIDNELISSSRIREFLDKGDIINANRFLGRNFTFTGNIIKGQQLGRKIGYPTANCIYPLKLVKIPYGVYSVDIIIKDNKYSGMMNFGVKPTINMNNKTPITETFIFDFDEDVYGEKIEILIKKMIRKEQKFQSLEDLKNQIRKDIQAC